MDTVGRCTTSYLLVGPTCLWCLVYMEINADDNPQMEYIVFDTKMAWSKQKNCKGMLVCVLLMIDLETFFMNHEGTTL